MKRRQKKDSKNATSKYKHVSRIPTARKNQKSWKAHIRSGNKLWQKTCDTEREAALEADKKLISMGEEPVNILKKITKKQK